MKPKVQSRFEAWLNTCPAVLGESLSGLPAGWREWFNAVPVAPVNNVGEPTGFNDPEAHFKLA